MLCPSCQHPNSDSLNFCENCGAKLSRNCPNCGQPANPSAKFCGNCGAALTGAAPAADSLVERLKRVVPKEFAERLLASRTARVEGERRIVTILFSDVKGSTALGDERDPEEFLEIMSGALDVLIEPVYRYEGTLARIMGDAILAFFGAPIAHEDDPTRAVLAGLAIQERMRDVAARLERTYGLRQFGVRVGINTGLVVVGEVGSDLRVEYTAMGDAINLASRLETAAEPGSIMISANTARLVKHAFELESVGPLQLKGKAEPIPAFRVLGRKAIPEPARGIEGLRAPMIGRTQELDSLRSRMRALAEAGQGQIVSVIGEAGLGKSRLVAELRQAAADVAVGWLEARCLSYDTATPYAPIIDLLRGLYGLHPEEADAEAIERVRAGVDRWLPGRADELTPPFGSLLGIGLTGEDAERVRYLEPPQLRGRIEAAVLELIAALATERPLVLVLEDLHWIDATSLDLAERLLSLTERVPLMLLAVFRPQRQEPSWRFHEIASRDYAARYLALALEPLDEAEARTLVAHLLEIEDLPERVRALILAKAEGNPFFVEEVIRSLLDARLVVRENSHWRATREIETIAVPDTLAGVITARLDRLDEDARRAAQTAAVIGREFEFDVLSQVAPEPEPLPSALVSLQRRELVLETTRVPQLAYRFKHALTQETAYASVLLSRRRELHQRVAECLERAGSERVNDIARHLLEAKQPKRALPYLIQAGDRAARAYARVEAEGFYNRALQILTSELVDQPELARQAYEGLGHVLSVGGEFGRAAEHFRAMRDFAREHADAAMQISALNKLANADLYAGQIEEADASLTEAEALAQAYDDQAGLAELYTVRCSMCNAMGNFSDAVHYLGRSAEAGRRLNIKAQEAYALTHTAMTLTFMARFEDAWETAQQARQVALSIGDRQHVAEALTFSMAMYHLRNGDLAAARRHAQDGVALAAPVGVAFAECMGRRMLGEIALFRGEYETAIAEFERTLQVAEAAGIPFCGANAAATLGTCYAQIGGAFQARADQYFAQAQQMLGLPSAGMMATSVLGHVANNLLAQGKAEAAAGMIEQALAAPTPEIYLQRPGLLVASAMAALMSGRPEFPLISGTAASPRSAAERVPDHGGRAGRPEQAAERLREAREFAESRGMRFLYPIIELGDAHYFAAQGQPERALEHFDQATSLAQEMELRPLAAQAHVGAAGALTRLGHEREAAARREQSRALVQRIADDFRDAQLRAAYLDTATSGAGR